MDIIDYKIFQRLIYEEIEQKNNVISKEELEILAKDLGLTFQRVISMFKWEKIERTRSTCKYRIIGKNTYPKIN